VRHPLTFDGLLTYATRDSISGYTLTHDELMDGLAEATSCRDCGGTGFVEVHVCDERTRPDCERAGCPRVEFCAACLGSGRAPEEVNL
jgi:hypothetical protein